MGQNIKQKRRLLAIWRYILERTKKNRELKLPARASLFYVGSGILVKLLGVMTTPIFTRVLSEEEYGKFTFYMSFVAIVFGIGTTLFSPAVIYKGLQEFDTKRDEYIKAVLYSILTVLGVVCLLLFTFSDFLGLARSLVLFLFLQLMSDFVTHVYESERRYQYEYMTVVKINVTKAVLAPTISLILLFSTDLGHYSRISGILIASLALAIPLLFSILRSTARVSSGNLFGYIRKNSLPLIPLALSSAVSGGVDKIIMNRFLGAAAVAKYSVACTVGIGLSFLSGSLSSALSPWVMRKLANHSSEVVRGIGHVIFRGICGAALFVIALAPEALEFLAPNRYSEAIFAVLPIAISILPSFLYTYSNIGLIYRERAGATSVGALLALAVNVALNLLLIPKLSYIGGGIALLASSSVMTTVNLIFLSRCGLSSMIDIKKSARTLVFTALFAVGIVLIYEYAFFKYLLLSVPAIMILSSFFETKKYVLE